MLDPELQEYLDEVMSPFLTPLEHRDNVKDFVLWLLKEEGLFIERFLWSHSSTTFSIGGNCYDEHWAGEFIATWELDEKHKFELTDVEILG